MQQEKSSTVIIFFLNGVNSLLGWTVVAAALDFFAESFNAYNVYSFLPVPLFLGYLVVGIFYHRISNSFRYLTLIVTGNCILNIVFVLMLVDSIFLSQRLLGFLLLLLCSFLLGIGVNLSQLSYFAMINYLSQNVVSKYTVGTGLAPLFTASIRAFLTAAFGSQNPSNVLMIIYFSIAMAFNTFDLLINVYFCKSEVYEQKIQRFLHQTDRQPDPTCARTKFSLENNLPSTTDERKKMDLNTEAGIIQKKGEVTAHEKERIQTQNYFTTLYETCMQIKPYPFIIMFTFAITFTLFPGPTFSKTFTNMPTVWSVIIFNLMYGLGDTTGKYVAQIKGVFNPKSLYYVFFSRLFFFFPISFMAKGVDHGDPLTDNYIFPFFIQFLFIFTNGFCINASFIMAFQTCPPAYKKYAGVLCGLLLQLGIMLGTIIEIPFSYIIGIN